MPVVFYPPDEDFSLSPLAERLEILLGAAEHYKAAIMDMKSVFPEGDKKITPKDLKVAFNWQELARVLREIRELPEGEPAFRVTKAGHLAKLAEVYEMLRAARMPKLEAVRMALMNEANQLRAGGTSQVM